MEEIQRIRSAHLRELLKFAEQQKKVLIAYGHYNGEEVTGATLVSDPYHPMDQPVEVQFDGESSLVIGHIYEGCLYLNHDLDGILLGDIPVPNLAGGMTRALFVSRVLDAAVDAAVDAYRNTIQSRQRLDYVRRKSAAARIRVSDLKAEANTCSSQIYEHELQLERAWKRKLRIDQELETLESLTIPKLRGQAEEEFRLLNGLVPERMASIRFDDDAVVATTHPVVIRYNDAAYEMGTFYIVVPLSVEGAIRIRCVDRVTDHTDYPHPHVSYDGVPCWGNLHTHVIECRNRGDLFHVVLLADDLLNSYNGSSPYVTIDHWDPDFEDHDAHEDCIQDADAYLDCVGCSDESCPYWESRFDRCWESIEKDNEEQLERCVECGLCDHHYTAAEILADLRAEEEEEDTNETVTEEARP